jgi:hypothetical protein
MDDQRTTKDRRLARGGTPGQLPPAEQGFERISPGTGSAVTPRWRDAPGECQVSMIVKGHNLARGARPEERG